MTEMNDLIIFDGLHVHQFRDKDVRPEQRSGKVAVGWAGGERLDPGFWEGE